MATLESVLGEELYKQVSETINRVNENTQDKTKQVRFVDLSEGNYISTGKYNDKVNTLTQQVTDLQGQLTQRDNDLADFKSQLEANKDNADKALEAQKQLEALQAKYDSDKGNYEKKLAKQAYEFAIKERANSLKFSSNSAKKAFVTEAINKNFATDNGNILGFDDFVNAYKTSDPDAFATDKPEKASPRIVSPSDNQNKKSDSDVFHFNFLGVRKQPKE